MIIKHRLRQDEQFNFAASRRISTKLIIPFERTDLGLGGRSLFVGQHGWLEMLKDLRGGQDDAARDILLLEALDELPSLDPFLLREHLKRRDFKIANCYFAISARRPRTHAAVRLGGDLQAGRPGLWRLGAACAAATSPSW